MSSFLFPATLTGFFMASLLKGSPSSWLRITSINVVIPFFWSSHDCLRATVVSSIVRTVIPFKPQALSLNLGETYLVTENRNERLGKQKLDLIVL